MKRDRIKTLLLAEALICALLVVVQVYFDLKLPDYMTPFPSPDSPVAQWGRD